MNLFKKKEPRLEDIKQNMMEVRTEHKKELPPLPEYKPPVPDEQPDAINNNDIAEALDYFYQSYKADIEVVSKNQLQLNTSIINMMTQLQRLEIELLKEDKKKR